MPEENKPVTIQEDILSLQRQLMLTKVSMRDVINRAKTELNTTPENGVAELILALRQLQVANYWVSEATLIIDRVTNPSVPESEVLPINQ